MCVGTNHSGDVGVGVVEGGDGVVVDSLVDVGGKHPGHRVQWGNIRDSSILLLGANRKSCVTFPISNEATILRNP